jgi:glucosamine-6-phosphate deaminase
METQAINVRSLQIGTLKIQIHESAEAAGEAAAKATAQYLQELGKRSSAGFGVIFATGASQLHTLGALTSIPNIPWDKITGFHMDEYEGIAPDHFASFRRYLRQNLTQRVQMRKFYQIDGNAVDPELECRQYAEKLRSLAPELCLIGIGENGHLAFNDPDVADFSDPTDMKIIELDDQCREQQLAEGWFGSCDEVPARALTLTIPPLFRVPKLIVSVPGPRKARIMRRTLQEPISTNCPATILRTHPDATVYLDTESAAELNDTVSTNQTNQNKLSAS